MEDAAHAFGTKYKKKLIGSQGDIACFSFDGIKNITSGEGGCVVTNDKKVIQSIKDSRLLGIQGDTNKRLRIEQDETRLGFEVDYDRDTNFYNIINLGFILTFI